MRFVKGGVSRALRTLRAAASPAETPSCRSRRRWWLRFAPASPPRRRVRVDRGPPVDVGTLRRRGSQRSGAHRVRRRPMKSSPRGHRVSRRPRSSATASTPQSCAAAGRAAMAAAPSAPESPAPVPAVADRMEGLSPRARPGRLPLSQPLGSGLIVGIGKDCPRCSLVRVGRRDGHRTLSGILCNCRPQRVHKFVAHRAACETPGAFGLAQSSILLVNTHSPWIADWMPALEDRRHAERWK